ncbi:hypothetical protein SynSYN20_01968 [Synechococcus sp. SYN20]|nr:hypothetical protein SynSYN20_01968 [Synechococcus sp. SYN20]
MCERNDAAYSLMSGGGIRCLRQRSIFMISTALARCCLAIDNAQQNAIKTI